MHEYNVIPELKKNQALKWYRKGMLLKDPYSHIRYYFIQRLDYLQFDIEPCYDEAIFSLIMACAYCNELLFKDDCLLKHDVNMFELLKTHINNEDPDRNKSIELINHCYSKNKLDNEFLVNWVNIKFASLQQSIKSFELQKKIAFDGHCDAAYNIGISYYVGLPFIAKSHIDAEKWFLMGNNARRARNYEVLAHFYERKKDIDLFFFYLQKANQLGSVECLWKLAYFYGSGVCAPDDKKLAFSFAKKSFLVSDSPYSNYALSYLLKHILNYLEKDHQKVATNLLYRIGEKKLLFHGLRIKLWIAATGHLL
jgi:TPR repeat protein